LEVSTRRPVKTPQFRGFFCGLIVTVVPRDSALSVFRRNFRKNLCAHIRWLPARRDGAEHMRDRARESRHP
jgi:hypothetical protein